MSFIDIFAWIVLVVAVATVVAIIVALGIMPGRIARKRGHPHARTASSNAAPSRLKNETFVDASDIPFIVRDHRASVRVADATVQKRARTPDGSQDAAYYLNRAD